MSRAVEARRRSTPPRRRRAPHPPVNTESRANSDVRRRTAGRGSSRRRPAASVAGKRGAARRRSARGSVVEQPDELRSGSTRGRAAASSRASGRSSRRRHSSSTTGSVSASIVNRGRTAAPFDEQLDRGVGVEPADRERAPRRRAQRLAARGDDEQVGTSPSRRFGHRAASATTCSQLSSTITSERPRRWPTSSPSTGAVDAAASVRPVRQRRAVGDGRGDRLGIADCRPARPARRRRSTRVAGRPRSPTASRVLPAPPGPINVTSRRVLVTCDEPGQSSSRPTNVVSRRGDCPQPVRPSGARDPRRVRRARDPGRAPDASSSFSRGRDRVRALRRARCEPRRTPATRRPGGRRGTAPSINSSHRRSRSGWR